MRRLLPSPATDVAPYEAARPEGSGPLVRLNMVLSADGRASDVDGVSGGLGGAADLAMFRALRAHADAILVGAGTARAERYRPHRVHADLVAARRDDGRTAPARIVVVTRSGDIDYTSELFTAAEVPTAVVTCAAAPAEARRAAAAAGELIVAGDDDVDLPRAFQALRNDLGGLHVLAEGGPRLNGALLAADLIDELAMTLAPVIAGGDGPAMVEGLDASRRLELATLHESDGHLFCRYRVLRGPTQTPTGQNRRSSPDSRPRSSS